VKERRKPGPGRRSPDTGGGARVRGSALRKGRGTERATRRWKAPRVVGATALDGAVGKAVLAAGDAASHRGDEESVVKWGVRGRCLRFVCGAQCRGPKGTLRGLSRSGARQDSGVLVLSLRREGAVRVRRSSWCAVKRPMTRVVCWGSLHRTWQPRKRGPPRESRDTRRCTCQR